MLKKLYRKNYKRIYVEKANGGFTSIVCNACKKKSNCCFRKDYLTFISCEEINSLNGGYFDHYWYIPE